MAIAGLSHALDARSWRSLALGDGLKVPSAYTAQVVSLRPSDTHPSRRERCHLVALGRGGAWDREARSFAVARVSDVAVEEVVAGRCLLLSLAR